MTNVPVKKLNVKENIELPLIESVVMYQHVTFIAAAGEEVGRVSTTSAIEDGKMKRSFKRSKFKPSVAGELNLGMRVNAILGIVSAIQEAGADFEGVLAVYANDAVVSDYNDGAAHRIVATGLRGNKEVTAEELTAWVYLSDAIGNVGLLRVRLLPISQATLSVYDKEAGKRVRLEEEDKAFKEAPPYKQFNHKMAAKAWDLVQSSVKTRAERLEEIIEEEVAEEDAVV